MKYLKQLGVTWVSLAPTVQQATAEGFIKIRASSGRPDGFKVYNIGSGVGPSGSLHNMPEVTLNLPGRDQKIEEYLNYIRYLGKAGIPYSTYAHMGNGIWSSGRTTSARAGTTRATAIRRAPTGRASGPARPTPSRSRTGASSPRKRSGTTTPTSSRRSSRWRRRRACGSASTRTIRRSRCWRACRAASSRNFEGYKRAIEIANSPNIGVCLCCRIVAGRRQD